MKLRMLLLLPYLASCSHGFADHADDSGQTLLPDESPRPHSTAGYVLGHPGDLWLDTMQFEKVTRARRDGRHGYEVTYPLPRGATLTLFWSRQQIDFRGSSPRPRLENMRIGERTIWFPDRLTSESLPRVYRAVKAFEHHYARQADGAIAAIEMLRLVAELGAMSSISTSARARPAPRASTPRVDAAGSACFVAGTPVLTKVGLIPIEDIRMDDRVACADPESGIWQFCQVRETWSRDYAGTLITLVIAGDRVQATEDHPFWVTSGPALEDRPPPRHIPPAGGVSGDRGRWVDARALRAGDSLIRPGGTWVTIGAVVEEATSRPVYNLVVEPYHTYAVGRHGVLVHNRAMNAVAAAREIAARLPGRLKCAGACDKFAARLQTSLENAGIPGIRIRVEAGPRSLVYSDGHGALSGATTRSGAGFHEAVRVGDTVFDNLRPTGISATEFFRDLGGAELIEQTGGNIIVIPF